MSTDANIITEDLVRKMLYPLPYEVRRKIMKKAGYHLSPFVVPSYTHFLPQCGFLRGGEYIRLPWDK